MSQIGAAICSENRRGFLSSHEVVYLIADKVSLSTDSKFLHKARKPALGVEAADLLDIIATVTRREGLV